MLSGRLRRGETSAPKLGSADNLYECWTMVSMVNDVDILSSHEQCLVVLCFRPTYLRCRADSISG